MAEICGPLDDKNCSARYGHERALRRITCLAELGVPNKLSGRSGANDRGGREVNASDVARTPISLAEWSSLGEPNPLAEQCLSFSDINQQPAQIH